LKITTEHINNAKRQIKKLQKNIDYDTRDYPVAYITQKFEKNDYYIPTYQRNKVWNPHQKERFIESLLLGYPIPLIFLSEQSNGKLEIVDGVQRITTLFDFISGNLTLKKLEKLSTLNGFTFSDIPIAEQRKLSDRSLRIIVLSEKTDLETRIDLFNRLNTSAERANDSEIRSGVLSKNKFQILITQLAQGQLFQDVVHLSVKKKIRKEDTEMLSRFFAYSNNYLNFRHSVKNFITDYIVYTGSSWNTKTEQKYKKQFEDSFNFAKKYFYKGFLQNERNQTPRVRFEALMCGINLALQKKQDLVIKVESSKELIGSPKFIDLTTTDASNDPKKVKNRIEYVRDFLLNSEVTNDA
jgi:hypothetical protein